MLTEGAPGVTTPTDTNITAGNATLGGDVTATGSAPLTARGVLYAPTATNPKPTLHGTGVVEVDDAALTTGVFTESVTGLTGSTGYSFVAFATNSAGTTYTSVATFTTLQTTTPTVTGPTDTNITSTKATLGGDATDTGGAPLTARGVLYAPTATNPNPRLHGAGVQEVDDSAQTIGVFTEKVTGLIGSTGYSFVAFATNSAGTTYTNPVSTFTTLAYTPPVNTVPGKQTATTTNGLLFSTANGNALVVTDIEAGSSGTDTVDLKVTSGSLAISIAYVPTFIGENTNHLILTGTVAQLNQTLNTLFYLPGVVGPVTLSIVTKDNGDSLQVSSSVTINVVAANTHLNIAPTVTVPPATQTVTPNVKFAFDNAAGNAISVGDIDGGVGSELVSLSVAQGTLNLTSTVGLTFAGTPLNSKTLTFAGRIDAINYDLQTLTYTPASTFPGADTLMVNINDLGNAGTALGNVAQSASGAVKLSGVPLIPVNTVPSGVGVVVGHAVLFNAVNSNAIAVADPAVGSKTIQVTLQVSSGTLSIAIAYGTISIVPGSNNTTLTLTGIVADVNNTLGTLFYNAGSTPVSDTLTMTSSDLNHGGPGGPHITTSSVAITVQAPISHLDAAPVVFTPTATQHVAKGGSLGFNAGLANAISVGDPDSGYNDVQVTLTVSHGTLSLTPLSGSSTPDANGVRPVPLVTGNGTASVTLTGRLDQINYILQSLFYKPLSTYTGADVLMVQISDTSRSNVDGIGGPRSASNNVNLSVS